MTSWSSMILSLALTLPMIGQTPSAYAQEPGWLQSDQTGRVEKSALVQTYAVSARALNFRSGPSVDDRPLASLQRDAFVKKLEETVNSAERRTWFQVLQKDGEVGWVASEYLTPVSDMLWMVEGAAKFVDRLGTTDIASDAVPAFDEIRAGFIYVGPIGDAGWTYAHEQGRLALEQLPFVTKTSYVESVPGDPALVMGAIETLVAEGHNVIFTTSYDHMDPTIEAARRFPDVVFMNCTGYKTERNAGTYLGRMYQARYLTGLIAGLMTKSDIVGYVAALPIPDVLNGINAFTLGAQSVNGEIDIRVEWTNTWYGPDLESEVAESLLDQGADILAMEQDSPAVIQAAAKRGKYAIGYQSDMSIFAPELTLTSAVFQWAPIYQNIAERLHNGVWQPDNVWWGLAEGAVGLAPMAKAVPQEVADLVEAQKQRISSGKLRVFEGPIRDASGEVRVSARSVMSDADVLSMDFFVQGVTGEMPTMPETPSDAQVN